MAAVLQLLLVSLLGGEHVLLADLHHLDTGTLDLFQRLLQLPRLLLGLELGLLRGPHECVEVGL